MFFPAFPSTLHTLFVGVLDYGVGGKVQTMNNLLDALMSDRRLGSWGVRLRTYYDVIV